MKCYKEFVKVVSYKEFIKGENLNYLKENLK